MTEGTWTHAHDDGVCWFAWKSSAVVGGATPTETEARVAAERATALLKAVRK